MIRVIRKLRSDACIGIILASVVFSPFLKAEDPPPDLARRIAQRSTAMRKARDHYTYRQSFSVEEMTDRGAKIGEYREIREVVFSPDSGRSEQVVGKPVQRLKRLILTDEDFLDVREIQPFLFAAEQLFAFETQFKGEENVDGVDCWVLRVRPRQILAGQRLFDGMIWASKEDFSIVRSEGKAVPEFRSMKQENLFPRFTTIWKPVDGKYRFPVYTYGDDTLDFRTGPQRIILKIRYSDYKRFGAESSVKFGEEVQK